MHVRLACESMTTFGSVVPGQQGRHSSHPSLPAVRTSAAFDYHRLMQQRHAGMETLKKGLPLHVKCLRFTQSSSRKRPFSAVSQLSPPSGSVHDRLNRQSSRSDTLAGKSADQARLCVKAHAASLDTEDLVSTAPGSDKARSQIEPLPQEQASHFDWHDQWYAIGYEK